MKKIDWESAKEIAELLHPAFEKWVKKRGFVCCASKAEIKLWYEFQEWLENFERELRKPK